MNRQEKEQVVDSLKQKFQTNNNSFVVEYKGLSVNQVEKLRRELASKGCEFKVAKARLMKRAVEGMSGTMLLKPYFKEQVALVFSSGEAAPTAKILYDFSKEHNVLEVTVGYSEDRLIEKEEFAFIALLPPRDVLLAQLCGVLMAPVGAFVRAIDQIAKRPSEDEKE